MLLEVRDLRTHIATRRGVVHAVDGVSFSVEAGRTLGIVGESGCGKSITALSIIGLLPPSAKIKSGAVLFSGSDLVQVPPRRLQAIRGREIGMIFQDPMSSLNPTMTIGDQIAEVARLHDGLSRRAAEKRAIDLLENVRISKAAARLGDYPHHYSGGMRQRVMIAIAIACRPKLLIADEPTTALDVTVQASVLDLIADLQSEYGMAMIIITHDMGVIADVADEVVVMYAGEVVEHASSLELFDSPEHPYTEALLGALPKLEGNGARQGRLTAIPGRPPELVDPPAHCRFALRCAHASRDDGCAITRQEIREIRPGHLVRTAHPRCERTGLSGRAVV